MLTDNALHYTLYHLLKVALPSHEPSHFSFKRDGQNVYLAINEQNRIIITLLSEQETAAFLQGKADVHPLRSADNQVELPMFQPDANSLSQPTVNDNGELVLPYDLITPSFFLLSRAEEQNGQPRDAHGRFRYQDSLAHHYGFIHLPLVDEYAMLLRQWIMGLLKPDLEITPRQHQLIPTHDIDLLYRFHSPWQAFKSIVGRDLLLDHDWQATVQSVREYRQWRTDSRKDPYLAAISELAQVEQANGLSPVFFFKAQKNGESDCQYDIGSPNILLCIKNLQNSEIQIGLHGSYESYHNPELFTKEKERLENVTGSPVTCCRQHYLRFGANTVQTWQACGITDDYTLGYAEQPGFRCGTCHPYPLFDTEHDCATQIMEHPLIVMDGSLLDYLHLDIPGSNALIERLRMRCAAVEGDFIILWHNHLLSRSYRTFYEKTYLPLIQKHR